VRVRKGFQEKHKGISYRCLDGSPIVVKESGNLRVLPHELIRQASIIAQNDTNLMNLENYIVNNIRVVHESRRVKM
jgi:hypothetical protein